MTRKGATKPWSMTFHLDTAIADLTAFEDLTDYLWNGATGQLANCFYSDVSLVGWDYYPAGTDISTHNKTLSLAGSRSDTGTTAYASDTAALLRYTTAARTSKGHPIYLFNYFHGVHNSNGGTEDEMVTGQRTNIAAFGTHFVSGMTVDSVTYKRAGPNGATATDSECEQYVTHRDFRK